MKNLCVVLLVMVLLTGVADAGLHGTLWRDAAGIYYEGFYNGMFYNSNDGVKIISSCSLSPISLQHCLLHRIFYQ